MGDLGTNFTLDGKTPLRGSDIEMAVALTDYLRIKKIKFDENGFPTFDKHWFLNDIPDEMLPFYHRNECKRKSRTCICFNASDETLYPRISSVFSDLDIYREYMGVAPMDLSVSRYMLLEVQIFNLYLNALFMATLGCNGIKIVAPIRYGSIETVPLFTCYSQAPIYSVGSIGTKPQKGENSFYENYEFALFKAIVIKNRRAKLLVYGPLSEDESGAWQSKGLTPYQYLDYHTRCKKGEI